MAVTPLNTITNFQLKPTTEATDEERKPGGKTAADRKKKDSKSPNPKEKFGAQENVEAHHDTDALELTSQIIDSIKVVELLAHRPKPQRFKQLAFKAQLKSETAQKDSQYPDSKKLNKAL